MQTILSYDGTTHIHCSEDETLLGLESLVKTTHKSKLVIKLADNSLATLERNVNRVTKTNTVKNFLRVETPKGTPLYYCILTVRTKIRPGCFIPKRLLVENRMILTSDLDILKTIEPGLEIPDQIRSVDLEYIRDYIANQKFLQDFETPPKAFKLVETISLSPKIANILSKRGF